jgi:hypothetical protein
MRMRLAWAVVALLCAAVAQAQVGPGPGVWTSGPAAKVTQLRDKLARPFWFTDFSAAGEYGGDFAGLGISSGFLANGIQSSAQRPGTIRFGSSANANSGYLIYGISNGLLLAGNEYYAIDLRPQVLTNATIRAGFCDTATIADCTDGAYFEIAATGVATGKTANNSTRSSTGTTYTLTGGDAAWYRLVVQLNATATSAAFRIYDTNGALLWSDSLATNIPTANGRHCGPLVIATESAGASQLMLEVDWMAFTILSDLSRANGGT